MSREAENRIYSAVYDISYFQHTRSAQLPCFIRWKDLAIPPFVHATTLRKHFMTQEIPRTILASFSGTIRSRILAYSGGLRQTWLKQFMDSKRVSVVSAEPPSAHAGAAIKADYKSNFVTQMLRSVFCLCPAGWATWTPRVFEALALGCIPVIVGSPTTHTRAVAMPFEDAGVDWSSLALFISYRQATRGLLEVLDAVPTRKVHQMQAAISRAWTHFVYPERLYETHSRRGGGAMHWVIEHLRKRLPSSLRV